MMVLVANSMLDLRWHIKHNRELSGVIEQQNAEEVFRGIIAYDG
ncbi:hypothetical protein [Granulicella sibirica]|nr:hypothetical protein [Granulicella sibirica]